VDMQQCQIAFDNFRAIATVVVIAMTVAGILAMVSLTLPQPKPTMLPTYFCRTHGCPEDECKEKHDA